MCEPVKDDEVRKNINNVGDIRTVTDEAKQDQS